MGSMSYAGHPAEAPEVEVVHAWRELPDGTSEAVTLTDEEDARCVADILENWDGADDHDDGYDG